MLQTDRKTDQTRQAAKDAEQQRHQRRQNPERGAAAALALDAILAGGSWEQLPADGVLSLSHTLGNDALLELFAMRETGPEAQLRALPTGACQTTPVEWAGGAPYLADGPGFAAMPAMADTAPMEL